ncbi:indolethylamine N-methyltransferase-like [Discoglossus pictus]
MAKSFSTPDKYIKEFNPQEYLDTYYATDKGILIGEWTNFSLKHLHETFTTGGVKGDTLIDIGSGPTIYHLLSACGAFKNIITSDFLPQNTAEVEKWLNKDPSAFDWTPIIRFVCNLEGNSENWKRKEETLRKSVKQVIKCDVTKKNPLEPHVLPPADCVISCLCLEVPCKDIDDFRDILKNLKCLIKPGGHLIVLSSLNCSFWYSGKTCFSSVSMNKESIERVFSEAGYEIEKMVVEPRSETIGKDICDYDGYYYIHVRKPPVQ